MSLQVSLKLNLTKVKKRIKVKYNTFDKATFDEYLICSAVLRTKNESEVFQYIDDITGAGSLNQHFRNIYDRVKDFSKDVLQKIMNNSMIPILKMTERKYDFYPSLNLSIFEGKNYDGDIGENESKVIPLLMISGEIVDFTCEEKQTKQESELYLVVFDNDDKVKIKVNDKTIDINPNLFKEILCMEEINIDEYQGTIHKNVDGDGWRLLNNATINTLLNTRNIFYDKGDYYAIRNDSLKEVIISKIHGLYIYKEQNLSYKNNFDLCDKIANSFIENKSIGDLRVKSVIDMLSCIQKEKAQLIINRVIYDKNDEDAILFGLKLIENGVEKGWLKASLDYMLRLADNFQLNKIYEIDSELNYTMDKLLKIDKAVLTDKHKEEIATYEKNLKEKRKTIIDITGEVTVSGLRENSKKLESDSVTKRFSQLCNRLIGHVNKGLENVPPNELEQWHKDALELKELSKEIKKRLKSKE